ncbi:unnamed protein product [Phytomonas sp. EM1]|nr:unnamed protein product [Phytomonas sp. EM1]|eukprot:CCW63923.1 unnamed protein product [Phytomonas sp. isolate EM1]
MTDTFCEASDFDLKASSNRIVDEARSIQQLIKHYQRLTRQFQDDVAQHVLKEVDESNRFKSLDTTVAEAELVFLRNSDFLTYSHERKEADVHLESIFPTSRMRAHGGENESREDLTEISWISRLNMSGLSQWSPDAGSSLKAHGDIREVFLGWRKRNDTLDMAFKHMCELLFDSLKQAREVSSPIEQKYVCFFNGLPFTSLSFADVGENMDLWKQFASFGTYFQSTNSIEDGVVKIAQAYSNRIIDLSSLTKKQFCEALWFNYDFESSSTPCDGKVARNFYNNFIPNVQCDAHDNIVLVDPSRMRGSQPFRGFFIKSELIAVEHIGTPVNVSLLLSPRGGEKTENANDNVNIMGQIAQMFQKIFISIINGVDNIPASTVMTVAFKYDSIPSSSNIGAPMPFQEGIVLDVRPISPSIPFFWHFTWAEICALGQLNRGGQVTRTDCDSKDVIFKVTGVSASSLLEYDTLSALVFPILNQEIKNHLKDALQGVFPHHQYHKSIKDQKSLLSRYPVIATFGAALILLGVGIGRLFRSSKDF